MASVDRFSQLQGRRFVVAGCGSIGRRHMKNLRTLGAGEILVCAPTGVPKSTRS